MDFPALSRGYGKDGIGLLLVPAWDFVKDGWLHDRMAVLRGVEGGFAIARAARNGLLTVSDNRGRIVAERSSSSAPFASLIATVPIQPSMTVYDRFGDWFAWFTIALLLGLLVSLRRPAQT
jgi:apolipoprotein N-acyltransferase